VRDLTRAIAGPRDITETIARNSLALMNPARTEDLASLPTFAVVGRPDITETIVQSSIVTEILAKMESALGPILVIAETADITEVIALNLIAMPIPAKIKEPVLPPIHVIAETADIMDLIAPTSTATE